LWAQLKQIGGFWAKLSKFETNWGGFWAELGNFEEKLGGFWVELGEKLGLHSHLFYVIFFSNCPPSPVAYRITERVSSWKMFNLKAILGND
jgi:hypothetical protein